MSASALSVVASALTRVARPTGWMKRPHTRTAHTNQQLWSRQRQTPGRLASPILRSRAGRHASFTASQQSTAYSPPAEDDERLVPLELCRNV